MSTDKMIHTYQIHGLPLQTGDIICTMNGKPNILPGEFWRLVGRLVPGDVDHVAMYLGPEGRCIESGALGVVTFEVHNGFWEPEHTMPEHGLLVDTFYGAAYPLEGRGLSREMEEQIREDVAAFSLAQIGKPYNLNFLKSDTDETYMYSVSKKSLYMVISRCFALFMPHAPPAYTVLNNALGTFTPYLAVSCPECLDIMQEGM